MSTTSGSAYKGDERKLVIAMDIGTTFSGVSYCFLDPGIIPIIQTVQKYPGQGDTGRHSKIPTLVAYGPNGNVLAVGAEVEEDSFKERIARERLVVAKWFKLHLRPKELHSSQSFKDIPPLPLGKTAVSILADFMRYLFNCAKTYIVESESKGANVWKTKREIVLTHPNGWEGSQQDLMRRAAISAGIIENTISGRDSVRFVTEGEASLHYCVSKGVVPSTLQNNTSVLVVDAGGGTVDISGYTKRAAAKLNFEETAAPQCYFHGSVFVTQNAREYLTSYLRGSKYQSEAALDLLTECFDEGPKLTFRNPNEPSFIRFGSLFDKDPSFNINMGKLKLDGSQVARFFQPSIDCISKAIHDANYQHRIKFVFLVGGFAESDWLFNTIRGKFQSQGITICRPEQTPGKAVSDGAISFVLNNYVTVRVCKFTYGTECSTQFDPLDLAHVQRKSSVYVGLDGSRRVPKCFSIILPKGTKVSETEEFRQSFYTDYQSHNITVECEILRYHGTLVQPKWVTDGNPSEWKVMRAVDASESAFRNIANQEFNFTTGRTYYRVHYDIVILFGLTELKAQIAWRENGVEKRSPARIIYDENNQY
ncbi:hypothetical protein AX16_004887 [Volvariella volvacea WC 439]|nr:hypothetical protein AX16_004887 [Volvariella volvacea WC 439]